MFDVDIPKLCGKEESKVVLHMDSASSHTALKNCPVARIVEDKIYS